MWERYPCTCKFSELCALYVCGVEGGVGQIVCARSFWTPPAPCFTEFRVFVDFTGTEHFPLVGQRRPEGVRSTTPKLMYIWGLRE